MTAVLIVLHVLVCVFLVAVVLLQRGKGAEIGAVFGAGASSTVFGSRGAGNFLTKLTTGAAIVFMITSLSLAYVWTDDSGEALFQDGVAEELVEEPPLFEEIDPAADASLAPPASEAEPPAETP